jgi:DNA-binding LacI/PurR family transcriptional regulator
VAQPTMEDVAHAAGVSRALVSLVMREAPNVSAQRRRAVLDAAAQLGYRPNILARNLASRRTKTLGVMINDLHNPFFAEAIDGIQAQAEQAGYELLLASENSSRSGGTEAIETFLRFRVDGLILTGTRLPAAEIGAAATACAVVLLGRTSRNPGIDTVNNDERVGARLAVQHLVELGHTRIAHIDGGKGAGGPPRRAGYERAMRGCGLAHSIRIVKGDFTEQSGRAAADRLLTADDRPTAIFAANDLTAAGALDRAGDIGLRVPTDLSIVGYDNTAIAAMHHMSLTTVNQPREEMGRIAVDLLLERLDEQRSDAVRHVVTPDMVTRSSTGRPNPRPGANS